jgi:DNA-binding SARP family transcriptional activator
VPFTSRCPVGALDVVCQIMPSGRDNPGKTPSTMLSFALLGPVQIALDRQPLHELVYSTALTLLAYLSVEQGRQFRRPELASLFWPEASHEIGLGNLRYALHRLRKALGDNKTASEPYLLTGARIGFNPASRHRLDVLELSTGLAEAQLALLESAAGLYRGEFLEGMTVDTDTDFGHWVQGQRYALARMACVLLSSLSHIHESRSDLAQAIGFARRQAQIDPCDEEVQRRIMLLLAQSGNREAALVHYESFRRYLAHELTISPGTKTLQLVEHIRSMPRQRLDVATLRGEPSRL